MSTADNTADNTADAPAPSDPPLAATSASAHRSRAPRVLAITGLVLAGVLTLGIAFAAGVGVGRLLPGHHGPMMGALGADHSGDRGDRGDRIDELLEQRDELLQQRGENADERRELFEQWLEQQQND